MLRTPFYDYEYWDLKFYYSIHVARQKANGNIPLKYDQFIKRLKKMNLHDALYTPRKAEGKVWKNKTPIQDNIRRMEKLKEQNVQIVTFEHMKKVENKVNMKPKKKTTLLTRFISIFK